MTKSFREWLSEGQTIYAEALKEYESIQSQIEQLESRLAEKRLEVNQVATMIGKPPVEAPKRISAQLVDQPTPPPGTMGAVTRALTGRGLVARESPPRA